MAHPANAAFISGDGLVAFDEYGRKLDSLGNVVHGDYQTLRGANAKPNEAYWQRKFEEEMRAMQPPPAPEAPQAQGMMPGLAVGGAGAPTATGAPTTTRAPTTTGSPLPAPAWQPPPSGLGMAPQGAPPRYDPLSSAVPGSQRTVENYVAGLGLPMPDNQKFDPPQAGRPMPPAMGAPLPPPPMATRGQGPMPSPYTPEAGEMGMPQIGQMGDNRRTNLMHVGGAPPVMPTRDNRIGAPQPMPAPPPPMATPQAPMAQRIPPPMGTPMPPARPPTWTPYQPYGVTAPLPGLSWEDEQNINQAVLWR